VALTVISDSRDKCDIETLDLGLDFINQLQPKKYFMNDRNKYKDKIVDPATGLETINVVTNDCSRKDDHLSVGLIAQDVMALQATMSDACCEIVAHEVNTDKLGIKYENLIPILINGMKEQQVTINDLLARIIVLESV